MNKKELIDATAEKCGLKKKEATAIVQTFLDLITETLINGEEVRIIGLGAFRVRKSIARTWYNPKTKKTTEIPSTRVPVFKAGKTLRAKM